jgi:uncharacterized membrane protein YtjA (UPF0391 family)
MGFRRGHLRCPETRPGVASISGTDRPHSPFCSQVIVNAHGAFIMLYWALIFLVVALIAGALGFGGIAGASAGIAQFIFFVFLVLLVVSVVMHLFRRA